MWTDILRRDAACPYPDALPRRVCGAHKSTPQRPSPSLDWPGNCNRRCVAAVCGRRLGGGGDRDGVRRGGDRGRCGRTDRRDGVGPGSSQGGGGRCGGATQRPGRARARLPVSGRDAPDTTSPPYPTTSPRPAASDVLHCPYCHGYEVRDAPIGVLGGDNRPFTLHQASLVRQWSADVVFFPHRIVVAADERERLTARGIRIVDGEVARLVVNDDRLSGVELTDGQLVPRTAVFVGPRFVPQDELLTGLGCDVGENGWVATDSTGRTSVTGVWAAGNVVDSPAQMITAAGAGTTAAIAINHYLLEQDIEQALAEAHQAPGYALRG
jgi:pyridine nucleotide-disulfide oxidoreductase